MYKTAEMVTPMHPDKLCDQISDAILDEILKQDSQARVAVEAMGGHGKLVIMGEVTTSAKIDYASVAKKFVPDEFKIEVNIAEQSPEIAQGVDTGGAGDQGIMVGYATSKTDSFMPLEYHLAREICQTIYQKYPFDGKTQVTLKDGYIDSVVASFQNAPAKELKTMIGAWLNTKATVLEPTIHANPAGDWQIGGFYSDTGLTGRKLAVDNYGPHIPIGGGAFSGKDPSKVDRSAAYMARQIALDLVNQHSANEVLVTLAYAIGKKEPLQATALIDGKQVSITGYDLTPNGIINYLNLREPMYLSRCVWGHF